MPVLGLCVAQCVWAAYYSEHISFENKHFRTLLRPVSYIPYYQIHAWFMVSDIELFVVLTEDQPQ